jgi:Ca2+-binding RTX toxin-like protein/pimeloyl-ACP methyl ester carboxylesterase/uncharacterized protein YegL
MKSTKRSSSPVRKRRRKTRRPQTNRFTSLRLETLEDRRMLSVVIEEGDSNDGLNVLVEQVTDAYEEMLDWGKDYYEARGTHPVVGGSYGISADEFLHIIPGLGTAAALLLDLGPSIGLGLYLDAADMLGWTQDSVEGYTTLFVTGKATLANVEVLEGDLEGGLFEAPVEAFSTDEPDIGGEFSVASFSAGPFSFSTSAGGDFTPTYWTASAGIGLINVKGTLLSVDVENHVLASALASSPLFASFGDIFLEPLESLGGADYGNADQNVDLGELLEAYATSEQPWGVRPAKPQPDAVVVDVVGGFDIDGDGYGDRRYPTFEPDVFGNPPDRAPYITAVIGKNTGGATDSFFIELTTEVPEGWFIGADDGLPIPLANDQKYDVSDIAPDTEFVTEWIIAPEGTDSGTVEVTFDVYHDGLWTNEWLGNRTVTLQFSGSPVNSITGRAWYDSVATDVRLTRLDSVDAIDPELETWIVIHGRTDGFDPFRNKSAWNLAQAVVEATDQQVLTLDWSEGADATPSWNLLDYTGEQWIRPTAQCVAGLLTNVLKFDGDSRINLVGHSWGGVLSAVLSEEWNALTKKNISGIVALDPAQDASLINDLLLTPFWAGNPLEEYLVERAGMAVLGGSDALDTDEVSFSAYSDHSWAFLSSQWGSGKSVETAEASFLVKIDGDNWNFNGLFSPDSHSDIKPLFAEMWGNSKGDLNDILHPSELGEDHIWNNDQFLVSAILGTYSRYGLGKAHEGVLLAEKSADEVVPVGLVYEDANGPQFAKATAAGVSVVEVIDRSGSMKGDKIADAKNAAKQFVNYMQDGDAIGIVSFDDTAISEYDLNVIGGTSVKELAKSSINSIFVDNGGTSIGDGVREAYEQFKGAPEQDDTTRAMIVLSDGRNNGLDPMPIINDIREETNPVDVYTIGLGEDADEGLLYGMALAGGGRYYGLSAGDLGMKTQLVYTDIAARVSGDEYAFRHNGWIEQGTTIVTEFIVDEAIPFFNAIVFWGGSDVDLILTAPDGTEVSAQTAADDPFVDFVETETSEFYRIALPMPGMWTAEIYGVDIPADGEEITFQALLDGGPNVSLVTDQSIYESGDLVKIQAIAQEDGWPVLDASVDATIGLPSAFNPNVATLRLYDDGLHSDGEADDGIYGNYFRRTAYTGSYEVQLDFQSVNQHGEEFTRAPSNSFDVTSADDTDGDLMPDNWEKREGTDWTVKDADLDLDSDDLNNLGEFYAGTLAATKDTDGDRARDGIEVQAGTDPLDPESVPNFVHLDSVAFPDTAVRYQPLDIAVEYEVIPGLGPHTIAIDWGDGSSTEVMLEPGEDGSGIISQTHMYRQLGTHDIAVKIADSEENEAVAEEEILISETNSGDDPMHTGETAIFVGGSTSHDVLLLGARDDGGIRVRMNRPLYDQVLYPSAGGTIYVYSGDGHDVVRISSNVNHNANVFAGTGNDVVFGAQGDDTLNGGSGVNHLYGMAGNDTLIGGNDLDFLFGHTGDDVLYGNGAKDFLYGDDGNDQIFGGTGNDFAYGGNGNDNIYGGDGDDYLFGHDGNDLVDGGAGRDMVYGFSGADILIGGTDKDQLFGGLGRDFLIGNDGSDQLFGELEDDILIAGNTVYDSDEIALRGILTIWTSSSSFEHRVDSLTNHEEFPLRTDETVFRDEQNDTLFGSLGADWAFLAENDKLYDFDSSGAVHNTTLVSTNGAEFEPYDGSVPTAADAPAGLAGSVQALVSDQPTNDNGVSLPKIPDLLWQNPVDRYDVNDDGLVTPFDALCIINALHRQSMQGAFESKDFLDVTGDQMLSPRDALLVINRLARDAQAESEPGSSELPDGEPANAPTIDDRGLWNQPISEDQQEGSDSAGRVVDQALIDLMNDATREALVHAMRLETIRAYDDRNDSLDFAFRPNPGEDDHAASVEEWLEQDEGGEASD